MVVPVQLTAHNLGGEYAHQCHKPQHGFARTPAMQAKQGLVVAAQFSTRWGNHGMQLASSALHIQVLLHGYIRTEGSAIKRVLLL